MARIIDNDVRFRGAVLLDPQAGPPAQLAVSPGAAGSVNYRADKGFYVSNGLEDRLLNNNSADRPGGQNLYSWSMNPLTATAGATTLTSGRVACYAVDWHIDRTINSLYYFVFTAGSGLTTGRNLIGLFDGTTGARLWLSGDQTTNFAAAATRSITGIATPVAASSSGRLIVGVLSGATTSAVTLRGSATSGPVSNVGCTDATGYNSWLDPATGLTAMPSSVTPFPSAPTLISTASFCVGP